MEHLICAYPDHKGKQVLDSGWRKVEWGRFLKPYSQPKTRIPLKSLKHSVTRISLLSHFMQSSYYHGNLFLHSSPSFSCHFQITRAIGASLLEVQVCIPRVACRQHLLTFFLCLSLFLSSVLEAEAKKACRWLRATGFPKYAQLFEGKVTQWFPLPHPRVALSLHFSVGTWGP